MAQFFFNHFAQYTEEALLEFEFETNEIVDFNHTYSPVSQRGKGIAEMITKTAMKWIEIEGLKFVAGCS